MHSSNLQGYLASIKDEKIGDFLHNLSKGKEWIGARRSKTNIEEFVWGDETPVTYASWMSGEPNNEAEGCVINNFHQPKQWIDASCVLGLSVPDSNVPTGFFCEMDPVAKVVQSDIEGTIMCYVQAPDWSKIQKFQKNTKSDMKIFKYSSIQVFKYSSIQVFKSKFTYLLTNLLTM